MNSIEQWKPVVGYPDYEVSDMGRVRSWKPDGGFAARPTEPRPVAARVHKRSGYKSVSLHGPIGRKTLLVHRIVLEAFVGPCGAGMQGAHENGVRADCRLSNLSWKTASANNMDKVKHGTAQRGERHNCAVLTEQEVFAIRELCDASMVTAFAAAFRVTRHSITNVITRKTWSHV